MIKETKKYDISIGTSIYDTLRKTNRKNERLIAEFIDNSLQSFLDHEDELTNRPNSDKCKVQITWDNNEIVILDNSYGMNEEEFCRALKLNAENPRKNEENRLSKYGMGLKDAWIHLGDICEIESSALNETALRSVKIDMNWLKEKNPNKISVNIDYDSENLNKHYTKIVIKKLLNKLTAHKANSLKYKLAKIYQRYIDNDKLEIIFNGEKLKYIKSDLLKIETGGSYRWEISDEFSVGDKRVKFNGWLGVLETGKQEITGLSIFQAQRAVAINFKPTELFGQGNTFLSSRGIGEIDFSDKDIPLSYNKESFAVDFNSEDCNFFTVFINNPAYKQWKKIAESYRSRDDINKKQNKHNKKVEKTLMNSGWTSSVKSELKEVKVYKDNERDYQPEIQYKPLEIIEDNKVDNNISWEVKNENGEKIADLVLENTSSKTDPWINLEKISDNKYKLTNGRISSKPLQSKVNENHFNLITDYIAAVLADSAIKVQKMDVNLSEMKEFFKIVNKAFEEKDKD